MTTLAAPKPNMIRSGSRTELPARCLGEWLAYAVLFVFVGWLTWPGLLSSDSVTIYAESQHWVFKSGHPPIMGIVWGLLNYVYDSTWLMLLLQLTLFFSGSVLLVRELFSNSSPWQRILVVYALVLSPCVLSIVGVIWKDIWCTAFVALAFGCLLTAYRKGRLTVGLIVGSLISIQMAILFRPNAVGAAVALMAGWLSLFFVLKTAHRFVLAKRAMSLVGGTCLALVLVLVGAAFDKRIGPGVPVAGIYFFDIAGIVMNSERKVELAEHIQQEYPRILRDDTQFLPMLEDSFMPYTAVNLNVDWGNTRSPFVLPFTARNLEHYEGAWKYLLQEDPVAYLRYRADFMRHLMGLYLVPGMGRNGWVLADMERTSSRYAQRYVSKFETTWLMSPAVWFAFAALGALVLLRPGASLYWQGVGWTSLSAIGMVAVLFFVAPAPDYRYSFWSTVLGIVMILVYAFKLIGRWRGVDSAIRGAH